MSDAGNLRTIAEIGGSPWADETEDCKTGTRRPSFKPVVSKPMQ